MRLAEVHIYPVKGARGIALERSDVLRGGLRHDRRFMILGANGTFLTQRSHPRLALLATTLRDGWLVLGTSNAAGAESVAVPLEPDGPRRRVRIWGDDCDAIEVREPGVTEFLSGYLGETASLVYMPDSFVRPVAPSYGAPGDRVGFADGYPLLLAARSSLDDLNGRLAVAAPMNRFRPNLVVEGGAAFEEERFGRARIGALTFRMPKRCTRCAVVMVDQATAKVGREPLRTLASYRRTNNKVHFAQNLIPDAEGTVSVGDPVAYLDPVGP